MTDADAKRFDICWENKSVALNERHHPDGKFLAAEDVAEVLRRAKREGSFPTQFGYESDNAKPAIDWIAKELGIEL